MLHQNSGKQGVVKNGEAVIDKSETLISAAANLVRAADLLAQFEFSRKTHAPDVGRGIDFYQEVTDFEISLIKNALWLAKGNQVRAAALLRLRPTTMNFKIKKYEIDPKSVPHPALRAFSGDGSNLVAYRSEPSDNQQAESTLDSTFVTISHTAMNNIKEEDCGSD